MAKVKLRIPETVGEWCKLNLPEIKSAPPNFPSNGLYLLAGAIAVSAPELLSASNVSSERYHSSRFRIKVHYPDGTFSNSPHLTLDSGGPQNKKEKDLEAILSSQSNGPLLDNCLIGINLTRGTGSIAVHYILIPGVVEAVIKNRMVTEFVDYRSQSAQKAT